MTTMRRSQSIYKHLTTIGVIVGAILLLSSALDDGHIDAEEWMQIGTVLFVTCVLALSHLSRANPRQIREHDYKLGVEQGYRLARRENRSD